MAVHPNVKLMSKKIIPQIEKEGLEGKEVFGIDII
jgi:hypothetical protein